MEPTAERFRALARSSPWRWRSLRFDATFTNGPSGRYRAIVRRDPAALRVEDLVTGDVTALVNEPRAQSRSYLSSDGRGRSFAPARAFTATPTYDEDSLVSERPDDYTYDYDDPMFRSYYWVAVLDPVELADGRDEHVAFAKAPGTSITGVRGVEHRSRTAWEAILEPLPTYEPRCSCCELLRSETSVAKYVAQGGPMADEHWRERSYADAFRVRLDVVTGVCVLIEEIGGMNPGSGHDIWIQGVDEEFPDSTFARPGPR